MQIIGHPRLGEIAKDEAALNHPRQFIDAGATGKHDAAAVRLRVACHLQQRLAFAAEFAVNNRHGKHLGGQVLLGQRGRVHGGGVKAKLGQLLLQGADKPPPP